MTPPPDKPKSPKPLSEATIVLLLALLVLPWLAKAAGSSSATLENRAPAPLPGLSVSALGDPATFADLSDYVEDRLPLRAQWVEVLGRAGQSVGVSTNTTVFEGPDRVLFLAEDFTANCEPDFEIAEMIDRFSIWDAAAEQGDKQWILMIAPDKGAILDNDLPARTAAAAWCANNTRTAVVEALAPFDSHLPLWELLKDAEAAAPGSTYYDRDSHWTFDAGSTVARVLVDRFQTGLWDPSALITTDEVILLRGDVGARLGLDDRKLVTVIASARTSVETIHTSAELGGTRPVRSYESTPSSNLISGTTLVLHDSMMNFVEAQVAPYFESITFVHWNDIETADFFALVSTADRVIIETVERSLNHKMTNVLLQPSFAKAFTDSLSTHKPA